MLDKKMIRENPEIVKNDLLKRGDHEKIAWVDDLLGYDKRIRELNREVEDLRHQRNVISEKAAKLKKENKDIANEVKEVHLIQDKIKQLEAEMSTYEEKMDYILFRLPNILHESVPVGKDDSENIEIRSWGTRQRFDFELKSHVDLLETLDLGDLERAAKISGARFFFLKNELVVLGLALLRFGIDFLREKGFTVVEPPFMIRRKPYEGVTSLDDFEDVLYKVEGEDLYLIATSEHPIGSMHMDEVLEAKGLPLKYAGVSPCFRKEAGAHGKDTKGIFRVHQFEKIEQFVFCKPEDSWNIHEELIHNAEEIYQKLEIPYRVVNICTGDIGSIAAKKYDIEAWMPAQGKYREVVSCSNCTDYQARRLNIKYRESPNSKSIYVHTLNSTLIAVQRTLVAILENYQQKDGTVQIPKALQPHMGSIKVLGKK
jgi:seryl-tRNA synthetase